MAAPVASNVEMTCTREVCHVDYSIPPQPLPLLRGVTRPTCRKGQLELRRVARAADAPRSGEHVRP